ncbi:conserved Plasmodium protein, unknown function [Plasmodium relictum]|uniref:RAP domain-containing protein n=1 Tax=Plasmodium relictum TaxID=85471 RepID=A0A1J1H3Y4_PLARL|nr:conserved Plasmodium protein, unknown function [Plasmodium relictum]CRG99615.1 conserved Plasmodium protein, unknown function [Plasmodium relictum]
MIKKIRKYNIFFISYKRGILTLNDIDVTKLSTKCLGNYAFDILRLSKENKELYENFKNRVNSDINLLDAKDCYRILKSLEISKMLNEEDLLKNILKQISVQTCSYSVKEICDICFLCSKLNLIYIPLFASLSVSFLNKINLATPENLSTICLSFCKIQIKDINLFNRIAVATLNLLHLFDIESLINVLISFSYLDIKKELLLYSSVDIFIKYQNKLDANQLVKVAYIYSKFNIINSDLNSMLQDKLPPYISSLNNIQLSELIISLNKLCINYYPINKFFTNVNLLNLKFAIAIKVINALSQLNSINIEFKYDEILFCINNFIFIHGNIKNLNEKMHKDLLKHFNLSYNIKNINNNIFKGKFDTNNSHKWKNLNNNNLSDNDLIYNNFSENDLIYNNLSDNDLIYNNLFDDNLNSDNLSDNNLIYNNSLYNDSFVNKVNSNHLSENIIKIYYYHFNLKYKLKPDSICFLSVDIFESLCNFLVKNNIIDFEEKLKLYLNYISKEIIFLKDYINFDCLIKIFSSLLKTPIIWNWHFLDFNLINSSKEKFLFYVDGQSNFYEELLKRYLVIFSTSDNPDNHSTIICSIVNLFKINEKKKYNILFEKCLEHYSLINQKNKNKNGSYILEQHIIYNYIDYHYKNIQLWNISKYNCMFDLSNKCDDFSNSSDFTNYNYFNRDNILYGLKNVIPNKILPLELYNIIYNFTKNIKINFRDNIFYISLLECDNYIAYLFLQPEDYFYSSNEHKEINFINKIIRKNKDKRNQKNSIILISDISYNPYETFYHDNYFIKSEALIKINYLLIKGYNIVAIPFYTWRCMSYEDKHKSIHTLRENILNS